MESGQKSRSDTLSPNGERVTTSTTTEQELGRIAGVGSSTINRVRRIHRDAPDLAPKLATGEMSSAEGERVIGGRVVGALTTPL